MRFILLLISISCSIISLGQGDSILPLKRNIVFAEYAVKEAYFSLNFEHIFSAGRRIVWSYRVGGFIGKEAAALPVGINAFTASGTHHLEFSFITTPFINRYKTISPQQNVSDKYVYLATTIGYRYQRLMGRLFLKASAGPILSLDPQSDHFWRMDLTLFVSAYLSAGIAF